MIILQDQLPIFEELQVKKKAYLKTSFIVQKEDNLNQRSQRFQTDHTHQPPDISVWWKLTMEEQKKSNGSPATGADEGTSNKEEKPGNLQNQRQYFRGKKKIQWKEEVDIVIVENFKEFNQQSSNDYDKTSCRCLMFQLTTAAAA